MEGLLGLVGCVQPCDAMRTDMLHHTVQVRFVYALPITVLKCLATLSYVPQASFASHQGLP